MISNDELWWGILEIKGKYLEQESMKHEDPEVRNKLKAASKNPLFFADVLKASTPSLNNTLRCHEVLNSIYYSRRFGKTKGSNSQ